MRPTPINESEGVIQRFFDPQRSRLDEWSFAADGVARSSVVQQFHASTVRWETGGGATVGRLGREVDVDASGYDHLILCATLPASARVVLQAVVDGREQTPIHAAGSNTSEEYEGPIRGGRISRLSIEIVDRSPDPGVAHLFWIGLFHAGRRDEMLAHPDAYSGSWDDMVLRPGEAVEPLPQLGLFFGEDDMGRLRAKAASSSYAPLMDRLRRQAAGFLDNEPWRGVGPFPNALKPRCYRLRGQEHISTLAMRLGAFVGLVDRDEALMRMALDHALALAHCDHWQPEFLATLPGSSWEQRAFYEYRFAQNTIFAWDWAGSYLTEAGRQLLAQAISIKALPWILQTLMRHPYVRACNQGVYFSWGAIVCELALSRVYPHATELLDAAVKALDETVTTYFAPDGGAFEGMGYATSTMGHALLAYAALARHRGVALRDVVPSVLKQAPRYIMTMISTIRPYGSAIKVADGGRSGVCLYQEALGPLLELTRDPAVAALLAGMLEQDECPEHPGTPGSVFSVIYGPGRLPAASASPPVFSLLEHTGMLCSNRPTEGGSVRLQLIGGPARAGHAHDDRGSFVIEAFGEEVAIERGQMGYDDPRCAVIQHARYHNVLIPEGPDGLLPRQLNPCPGATLPEGEGDETVLRCSIDVTAAWGGLVERCVRSIESDEPARFAVTDEVRLPEAKRVSFHLHGHFPWERTDEGWVTRGRRAELTVSPQWQTAEESGREDFVDGDKSPVYHLTLVAPPARSHVLRTELHVRRALSEG